MLCVVVFPACGDEGPETLPRETFQQIYGEILYKAELYRDDTLRLRREFDSLLLAYDTDTTALFATAREITRDRESVEELYRVTIERFERVTRGPDSLDNADSVSVRPGYISDEDY
jgi:hypothetical protein